MGQGMSWVWGFVIGAGCYCRAVCAAEFERPSMTEAETALADLSWVEIALNERAVLLEREPMPVPGFNDFTALKLFCSDLLPHFVDPLHADQDGDFSAYLDENAGVLPVLEVPELVVRLRIPANYFTYTPMLWGGMTLAANDQTAGEGDVSPAGQTEWSEADFGPAGLRRVIGEMVWTQASPSWTGVPGENNVRGCGTTSGDDWDNCIRDVTEHWPGWTSNQNYPPWSYCWGYSIHEELYVYDYMKIWNDLEISGLSTQRVHGVDFYLKCVIPSGDIQGTFDNQGVPKIRDGYSRIEQFEGDIQDRYTVRVGDTGDAPMTWCDKPHPGEGIVRGWRAQAKTAVIRWDFWAD
jgi:hypothetical protein